MKINVPYRSEFEIESEAGFLLAECEKTTGGKMKLPIPVERSPPFTSRFGWVLPTCMRLSIFLSAGTSRIFSERSGWRLKPS